MLRIEQPSSAARRVELSDLFSPPTMKPATSLYRIAAHEVNKILKKHKLKV